LAVFWGSPDCVQLHKDSAASNLSLHRKKIFEIVVEMLDPEQGFTRKLLTRRQRHGQKLTLSWFRHQKGISMSGRTAWMASLSFLSKKIQRLFVVPAVLTGMSFGMVKNYADSRISD